MEYTLGGHTASVNVVKWGGSGGLCGVLYTASSDRTVRIWDAEKGRALHMLKDHAHWVTTLALNTDFVLRTGPFDHTNKKPASDEEGSLLSSFPVLSLTSLSSQPNNFPKRVMRTFSRRHQKFSSPDQMTTLSSSGLHSPLPPLPVHRLRLTQPNQLFALPVTSVRFAMLRSHPTADGPLVRHGIIAFVCGRAGQANLWLLSVATLVRCIDWHGVLTAGC